MDPGISNLTCFGDKLFLLQVYSMWCMF